MRALSGLLKTRRDACKLNDINIKRGVLGSVYDRYGTIVYGQNRFVGLCHSDENMMFPPKYLMYCTDVNANTWAISKDITRISPLNRVNCFIFGNNHFVGVAAAGWSPRPPRPHQNYTVICDDIVANNWTVRQNTGIVPDMIDRAVCIVFLNNKFIT